MTIHQVAMESLIVKVSGNNYDSLMKEAEEENKKREDKLQKELMTEDPLNVNYARWATEEEFRKDLVEVSMKDCSVEIILASYYSEIGLFLSATKTYESVTTLALSLVGVDEYDVADRLYLKIASVSCRHSFEYYSILNNKLKMNELNEKFERIQTLSNQ